MPRRTENYERATFSSVPKTMTHVSTFAEIKEQLRTIISSGDAALMIGAGASVSSGGPTGQDLTARILAKYKGINVPDEAKLLDLGTAVCDSPQYGRLNLVRFVCEQFEHLSPSNAYKQLPRVRWRALFTTNYDDLIEQAYRSPSRSQTLQVVHPGATGFLVPRAGSLYLFYLMGSVRAQHDSNHSPAVSWSDFLQYVQDRAPMLQAIVNILAEGGQFIYVGYSFNDFLLDTVLDEAARKVGNRNTAYGYAILTGWPDDRKDAIHKLLSKKVMPVEGSFEDLAALVGEIADENSQPGNGKGTRTPKQPSPAAGRTIAVAGRSVAMSETEWGVYSEAFEIVDTEASNAHLATPTETPVKFFKGESLGWTPFSQKWAFKRPAYAGVLSKVLELTKDPKPRENSIVLAHGPAGLGKTVMARQLAFDLATESQLLVLLARASWRARPDPKLIDRFCDDVEVNLPEGENLPALVLIIDEAELLDRATPHRISTYLRSRGRAATIVMFARTNEYYRAINDTSLAETVGGVGVHPISIEERISDSELETLIAHITSLGIWRKDRIVDPSFWKDYVRTQLSQSFFDTIYSLVEETQQPLRERIASEYEHLSELARKAYLLIAATHQFGIPLKMEILMRALSVPYPRFEEEIIRSDARDVLFTEHESSDLNLFFRGRTRLISQLIFERAASTRPEQLVQFRAVIAATNPNDMFGSEELDSLRLLLVQVLGPSGYDKRFSDNELAELFEVATAVVQDDVLEHHYGIVEREAGRFMSARKHLEKALELSQLLPYDLAVPRESRQNIENSLALVVGKLALEAVKRNDLSSANALYQEAREHFLNAKAGTFPNAHAYDALARMLRERALRLFKPGTTDRAVALAEVLDVISEGLDNVNPDGRPNLVELRTEVFEDLGLETEALNRLETDANAAAPRERARYLILIARVLLHRRGDLKNKTARKVLSLAIQATEADADYFPGWKIKAEMHAFLHPEDRGELLEILGRASKAGEGADNIWVLYEYAVTAFYLERYELSASTFGKLRKASAGHNQSGGVIEVAGNRDGPESEPYEYEGYVTRQTNDRTVYIRCEELSAFGDLWFNLRGQRYYTPRMADRVSFVVGFNYRGLLAVDLRRI